MTDPSLDLQQAIRARLIADPTVTALVPAISIFDRNRRPEVFPCIIMGEGQTVRFDLTLDRNFTNVYVDLHIWQRAEALASAKAITGPVYGALRGGRLQLTGNSCIDHDITHVRFMRDPAGELVHGIMTVKALVRLADVAA